DDVHGPRFFDRRRLEIFLGEDDEASLLVLVALDEILPSHSVAIANAHALEPHGRLVFHMKHAEPRAVVPYGGVQLDRNVDEAERNRSLPKSSGHDASTLLFVALRPELPFRLNPVLEVHAVAAAPFD